MNKVSVIGSGFSGLSAACYLSQAGYEVSVFEKNETAGGRARKLVTDNGFVFDMGPSWYWMPGVFEKFFSDFGYSASDFYELKKLDPAFDMVFSENEILKIPGEFDEVCSLFDSIEEGSSLKLKKFLAEAEYKYNTGINDLVYKPSLSFTEFADFDLLKGMMKLQVFSSFRRHVNKFFSDKKLRMLMEFPVLFLGASPADTPALYSLMNYAALKLGTYYPAGGFSCVIEAFLNIARSNGVRFYFNSNVEKINANGQYADSLIVNGELIHTDGIIASADYHHIESDLLGTEKRNYDEEFWSKKIFAPSCLIYYLGISKKLSGLNHHTLFFDEDMDRHIHDIYEMPSWPDKPLFYVCCTSRTDPSTAPEGCENLFLLMPVAAGLTDNNETRERYFRIMIERLSRQTGEDIKDSIINKQSYCISDFMNDYNSYKGNAYGLANTLSQTAILRPKIKNYKIKNMFYAGQLTVPGPGVPPSIISGKISAGLLDKFLKKKTYEAFI